jgi:hypothetical protein
MDIRSRALAVGTRRRTAIGAGKHGNDRAPSCHSAATTTCPSALPIHVSRRRPRLPDRRLHDLQFADPERVPSIGGSATILNLTGRPEQLETDVSPKDGALDTGHHANGNMAEVSGRVTSRPSALADWPGERDAAPTPAMRGAGHG